MATVDSPSKTVVTGKPADTDPAGNLLIKIDVGTGTFHCAAEEHVGTGKNRHVTFQPDAPCKLCFGNFAVFQTNEKQLAKGDNPLPVLDETNGVKTSYYLDGAKPEKVGPPVIVVP